jgi:hypothetical protein
MTTIRNATIIAAGLLPLLPGVATAGAWVQREGEAYIRLTGGYLEADERFDKDGNKIPFNETIPTVYQDFAMTLYTELGVHPQVTLIGDVNWKALEANAKGVGFSDSSTTGFADARLGLKVGVGKWNTTVASIGGVITFPTGYDPTDYPALGSDVTELTLDAQIGDASIKSWINGEAWIKFRGGDFRDQIGGALGMGFDVAGPLAFRGEGRGGLPLGKPRENNDPVVDPADFDPAFFDLAGTLSFRVGGAVALEAEARTTVGGRNTLRATRWTVGIATSPAARLWEPPR